VSIALAALSIALLGAGLTVRLRGGLRVAAALLLGLGSWSAAYAAALLLFGKGDRVLLAKDLVLAVAGALLMTLGGSPPEVRDPRPEAPAPGWLWISFAASCALATAAVVEHTLRFPDGGYDAWMIWNTRARFLVRAADFHTAFSPRLLFWLHQDYPWLVPGAVAQVFLLGRSESLALPAALSWLFAALALAVLTLAVARLRGLYWGLLAGLALATMPCFATFAANQQSDVPLSAFLVLCVALLSLAEEERRDDLLLLSGFAAGLGAWTKNEGLLYLGCAAVALLFRQRRLRPVAQPR
jgi:4-amino-4-deoxy-L-arabinose transferase-like glycosyltransferase